MQFFEDISKYKNTADYLPMLIGVINADVFIFTIAITVFHSAFFKGWYREFQWNALVMDVTLLMLSLVLARFLYSLVFTQFHLMLFLLFAGFAQVVNDFLFYGWIQTIPNGRNRMLDYMKKYVKHAGPLALLLDAGLTAFAALLASHFAAYSLNWQLVCLTASCFFIPHTFYLS